MKVCPYCAFSNREGVLFCEECGQVLYKETVSATRQLPGGSAGLVTTKNTWGTARFQGNSMILLHIRDVATPIEVRPDGDITMGRYDSTSTTRPTVDMTPFGAFEKGVSRTHALIRRGEDTVTLIDLGSANGTYLNGQRMIAHQPRVLRDGDEVRLGKLVLHVYFRVS